MSRFSGIAHKTDIAPANRPRPRSRRHVANIASKLTLHTDKQNNKQTNSREGNYYRSYST